MKIRNNIYKLLALGLLATPIAFTSCSEDRMDEINFNPNNPTDVEAKFILADVITATAVRSVGGDLNTYLSTYVEHEVGTHNQLWNAEHRDGEPQNATTFNNSWNSIYETIKNARIIVEKCSEGGQQEGNYTTLGVGQILLAYNMAILTDMYGDVPFSEAFDPFGNKTPKVDKQEAIYAQILTLLNEAIVNIPKGDNHVTGGYSSHDLLFNGGATGNARWIKFANGLKARYTMRLLHVSADKTQALEDVIEFVDASFVSSSEEASFNVYNAQNLNPLFDFQWSRDGLAASQSIADKMIERNDPRRNRNFTDADLVQIADIDDAYGDLAPNGENDQIQYFYLTSTFVYSQTASTQLLSFHELQFLKAEAMQRLGRSTADIEPVLKAAVEAAIVNSENSVKTAFVAPTPLAVLGIAVRETSPAITSSDIDTYFEDEVKPLFLADPLKEIAVQKYLAFFGASGESTEMYNDVRRWKALGDNLIELKNPNNASKFPLRLPYGSSETTTNPNVEAVYGNGTYVYSENVWWAGGTR